jgi:hypothetical protein
MPTFNYPESNEQPAMDAPKPPKKDFRNVIYVLLTVGLLGSLAYIWLSKKTSASNSNWQPKLQKRMMRNRITKQRWCNSIP